MSPDPLDGNATAGELADIFAFDATTAITTCATCRHTHPVATLRAYLQAPGMVLRCASCDAVQLRFVRSPRTSMARPARHRHARNPAQPKRPLGNESFVRDRADRAAGAGHLARGARQSEQPCDNECPDRRAARDGRSGAGTPDRSHLRHGGRHPRLCRPPLGRHGAGSRPCLLPTTRSLCRR